MLDHIDFGTSDYAASRDFYSGALAPLGIRLIMEIQRRDGSAGAGYGRGKEPQFWIGEGQAVAGRLHVAFTAQTRRSVDEFYAAALAAGANSKGEPGFRPRYGENYYAAFVYDPDGHTVEAVCRAAD